MVRAKESSGIVQGPSPRIETNDGPCRGRDAICQGALRRAGAGNDSRREASARNDHWPELVGCGVGEDQAPLIGVGLGSDLGIAQMRAQSIGFRCQTGIGARQNARCSDGDDRKQNQNTADFNQREAAAALRCMRFDEVSHFGVIASGREAKVRAELAGWCPGMSSVRIGLCWISSW